MHLEDTKVNAPRLSEVLFEDMANSFLTLAPLACNVEAIEHAMHFAAGRLHLFAIVGPSGWGKTHLLTAISERVALECRNVAPVSLPKYLSQPMKFETCPVLMLDDVQDVFGKPRGRQDLLLHLERRVRAGKSTALAFTAPKVSRPIKALLPNSREWTICEMNAPSAVERIALLGRMSDSAGLTLSPQLTKLLAHHLHGNGRTLSGALKRLRLAGPRWLTSADTLRACGHLDPFIADSGHWDLKLRILRTAEAQKQHVPDVNTDDLALYTMLCVAGLSEADVARAAAVEPAEAYGRAMRFGRQTAESANTALVTQRFVELVVDSLIVD